MDEIDLNNSSESQESSSPPPTMLPKPDPLNETTVSAQETIDSSEAVQSDSVSNAVTDVANPNPPVTSAVDCSVSPPPPPNLSYSSSSSYAPTPSIMAGNQESTVPPQINPYFPTESPAPPPINPSMPNYGQVFSSPVMQTATEHPQYSRPISQPVFYTNESNVITQQHSMQSQDDENVTLPDDLVDVYNHLGIVGKILTGGSIFTIRFLQMFRNISETLVDALGITRPRYEGEYLAYEQMKQEEQQRQANIETLYATWQQPNPNTMPLQTSFLQPNIDSPVPDSSQNKTGTNNPTSNISVFNMDCPSPPDP